jgi:hypothetical protein
MNRTWASLILMITMRGFGVGHGGGKYVNTGAMALGQMRLFGIECPCISRLARILAKRKPSKNSAIQTGTTSKSKRFQGLLRRDDLACALERNVPRFSSWRIDRSGLSLYLGGVMRASQAV